MLASARKLSGVSLKKDMEAIENAEKISKHPFLHKRINTYESARAQARIKAKAGQISRRNRGRRDPDAAPYHFIAGLLFNFMLAGLLIFAVGYWIGAL